MAMSISHRFHINLPIFAGKRPYAAILKIHIGIRSQVLHLIIERMLLLDQLKLTFIGCGYQDYLLLFKQTEL
jgi:hypothetical protein